MLAPQALMETMTAAPGGHGGNHVEVEGSFDNWTMRQPMQRSGKDFTIVKLLPPGVYQVPVPAGGSVTRFLTHASAASPYAALQ